MTDTTTRANRAPLLPTAVLSTALFAFLLSACASGPAAGDASGPAKEASSVGTEATIEAEVARLSGGAENPEAARMAAFREKIVTVANGVIGVKYGQKGVTVAGKTFTMDCIGTVSALYWGAGVDITADFGKYDGNGVSQLYQSLRDRKALREGKAPEVGDVVFWDNTWDRNEDGVFGNDPLTHAGVVVKVDPDGTAHYVHANVFKGVTIEFMNLDDPSTNRNADGKVINSGLYMGSYQGNPKNPPRWTSGDLWKVYGDSDKTTATYGFAE